VISYEERDAVNAFYLGKARHWPHIFLEDRCTDDEGLSFQIANRRTSCDECELPIRHVRREDMPSERKLTASIKTADSSHFKKSARGSLSTAGSFHIIYIVLPSYDLGMCTPE